MVGVLRLFGFVVDRLAEPLSARFETMAADSPAFRGVCSRVALWHHSLEYEKATRKLERDSDGQFVLECDIDGQPLELNLPEPMSEKEATSAACELLGEGLVWTVGLAVFFHSEWSDSKAEQERAQELEALQRTQRSLLSSVEALEKRVVEAERHKPPQRSSRWWSWPSHGA